MTDQDDILDTDRMITPTELRRLAAEADPLINYEFDQPMVAITALQAAYLADEVERLHAALRELVRLKDLHDACEDQTYWLIRAVSVETLAQLRSWEADYAENKPRAWSVARAIVGKLP